jgi:transposase-like protein
MESASPVSQVAPEVEVLAKARRRFFTAEYKQRILREAERCTRPGEIAALLRREGLYSSHLTAWRQAAASGLAPKKRGPVATKPDARDKRIAELERELRRATRRAERAEGLVEVQKKVAELLGFELDENGERREPSGRKG